MRLISQITGKRFILPGTTRSIKATVYAPTKVTAGEAYQAFLSILELNGMAIVPAGRYLKIVESQARRRPRDSAVHVDETVPEGDRYLTRLQRVTNISAEDAATLLERFKSGDGNITAYAPTNMLIITDTGTNIRRMVRILEVVDVARDRRADLGRARAQRERDRARRSAERDLRAGARARAAAARPSAARPHRASRGAGQPRAERQPERDGRRAQRRIS